MEQLLVFLALHGGVHHTAVDKDDGAPEASGPRFEVEAGAQPRRWFSVSLTCGYWRYRDDGLHDFVTSSTYDVRSSNIVGGLRLLVYPHPRVFLGGGISINHETETLSSSSSMLNGSSSRNDTFVEAIAGGTVARIAGYDLQAMATFTAYGRYDGLEHVEMGSLMLGVRRSFSAAR